MNTPVDRIVTAIEDTGIATVASNSDSDTSINLLVRVSDKPKWLDIISRVLLGKQGWSSHICQKYFVKDDRVVYGWCVVVTSDNLSSAAANIVKNIKSPLRSAARDNKGTVLQSFPLVGYGAHRTAASTFDPRASGPMLGGNSHKGAYKVG